LACDLRQLRHHLELASARLTKLIWVAQRNLSQNRVYSFVCLRTQLIEIFENPLERWNTANEQVTVPGKTVDLMVKKKYLGITFVVLNKAANPALRVNSFFGLYVLKKT